MNNITYAVSVDVNNPIIPYNVYVANVLDSNVRYLEITLYQNGNVIALSNEATATASLVTDDVLVDDSVECTISNNIITVPLEDLQRHGNLDVQVTVTEGTKVLAIPFPIQVRVTPNIAENAQIDENSLGSYAEVVQEIAEARGTHTTLHDAITAKLDDADGSVKENNIADESITVEKVADDLAAVINAKMDADDATVYHVDTTTQTLTYGNTNPKTIYLNARVSYGSVSNRAAVVITTSSKAYQFAVTVTGDILMRSGGGTYPTDWTVLYGSSYKKNSINDDNKNSSIFIPTIGAVVSYLAANYIGNGSGTVTETNLATALKNSLYHVDNTTENVVYNADNPRIIYTNARVNGNKPTLIFTLGDDSQLAMHKDGNLYCRTYANGAYGSWIDLKAMSIGESNKTSGAYPTVQAVYNFVAAFVASAISGKANTTDVNTALDGKENLSNKVPNRAAMDNLNSETQYPSIKTMVQYTDDKALDVLGEVSNLKERLDHTGAPTDEQVTEAVEEYLEEHPPAGNFEIVAHKKEFISNRSQTGDRDIFYPTVGAVRDFVTSKPLSSKFIHMSVDDTSQVVAGINSSSVTSIYNIPLISYFKQMHDTYGMVFSFYVQNIAFNFDTTTTPGQEKKAELFAARDWLKWGLHNATGSNSTNYANATYETGQTDWNNFVKNIITYIGTTEAVDRIPRLENFASSEACAQGMRDAKCGVMGFLGADDTRAANAWLTAAESKWLGGWVSASVSNNWVPNDYWTDYSNGLRVYKTDLRLELFGGTRNNIDNPQVTTSLYDALVEWYTDIRHGNAFCPMILFTHEQFLISSYSSQVSSTYQTYLADIGRFGNDYGVAFDFPQNKFIATPQKLDRFPTIGETAVVANPTLDGTEASLTGLQVSGTKYKVSYSSVAVTGVSVPSTQTVEKNGTRTISATISPADASNRNVTWSIEIGNNLVSITPNGLNCEISGSNTGTGTAVIRATTVDGSYHADCTVTVVAAIVPVTGITLSSNSLALDANATPSGTITATIAPASATAQTVNYTIQSGNCVSISQNGLSCTITMVSKGSATVRCSATDSSGIYADCEVTCTWGALPDGYTELEYVESPTRDCSVSTGITLETDKNYTYDTKIQFTNLTPASGQLFQFNGANDGAFVGINCAKVDSLRLVFGDATANSTYGIAADLLPHTFVCPFTCKSTLQTLTYTIDGNSYSNPRNYVNPEPVYVFCTNPTNTIPKPSYFCQEKVYWFTVYKEGTLVAHLVPCRRDADGEYGMYDIVQNVFRENLGTGTLTGA